MQPHRTLVVDVTDSPDTLLARMKPKTRYNIGLAYRPLQYGLWGGLWPVARRVRRRLAAVQALDHSARPTPDLAVPG